MATQYGTIKLETPSGPIEVPVWDAADVDYPVYRVQTPSGVGAINLVDPAEADYPYVRVQTASGVKAIKEQVLWEWYDDFEDGTLESEYYAAAGSLDNWTEISGKLEPQGASNDDLAIDASSTFSEITASIDFYRNATTYAAYHRLWTTYGGTGYSVTFRNTNENYDTDLMRLDDGSGVELIDMTTHEYQKWHTWKVTRTDGTWEGFKDGASQGTTVDSTYDVATATIHGEDNKWRYDNWDLTLE